MNRGRNCALPLETGAVEAHFAQSFRGVLQGNFEKRWRQPVVERRKWRNPGGAAAASRGPARVRRSTRFLQVIHEFDRALVVAHDNPDPDAISTGWAIMRLIECKLQLPVRMIGGGHIVRAENRQMVELLNPPIELMDCARWNRAQP